MKRIFGGYVCRTRTLGSSVRADCMMRKPAASDPYLFLYLQPCTTIPVIGLGAAGIRGFLPDAGSILACPTPLAPYDGLGRGEKGGSLLNHMVLRNHCSVAPSRGLTIGLKCLTAGWLQLPVVDLVLATCNGIRLLCVRESACELKSRQAFGQPADWPHLLAV